MCIPCGPRYSSRYYSRTNYKNQSDAIASMSIEEAREHYQDNEEAIVKITEFIKKHIGSSRVWIYDCLYYSDLSLARIWAERENRGRIKAIYETLRSEVSLGQSGGQV